MPRTAVVVIVTAFVVPPLAAPSAPALDELLERLSAYLVAYEAQLSSGRIWIDPAGGTIWRIEWFYQEEKRRSNGWPAPRLRVDFEPHQELGIMVPLRMTEVFSVDRARGEGKATYRNFRRFGTSARIVPQ